MPCSLRVSRFALIVVLLGLLAACAGAGTVIRPTRTPQLVREELRMLLPARLADREGWAADIQSAFAALELPADTEHLCAVLAITEQESSFQADPRVPNLAALARTEIMQRAQRLHVPALAVRIALQLNSPDGRTYDERLDAVRTERELSNIFEDFIAMVPLGRQLLSGWNPVRTGGPMQVSVAFAEQHLRDHRYPYPMTGSVRDEVFGRRGGLYFGIAHLLAYPAEYDAMRYRFADFNAGHYASRNAAFQLALGRATGRRLATDGDLLRQGSPMTEPGETEAAARTIASALRMDDAGIRRALGQGDAPGFERSEIFNRVFEIAERRTGHRLARAALPDIALKSPKITRKLSTAWFANRVDSRYQRCIDNGR